jgi:hypothetical protein
MSAIAAATAFALAGCASDPISPTSPSAQAALALRAPSSPSILLAGSTYHASAVVSSSQGTEQNGGPVDADRSDPNATLGPSDGPGAGTFFSLGFGGQLVVKFAEPVSGDLAIVHEVTFAGTGYPEEKVEVYVSIDGIGWTFAGHATNDRPNNTNSVHVSSIALPVGCWQYVKLVDVTALGDYANYPDADGFDVDAIAIENAVPCPPAGCSPGYFKTHLVPGEGNTFQFYGVNDPRTLRTALDNPAGGPTLAAAKSQLLHQAAAAILNSILTLGFPSSTAAIVAMTNTALASTDRSAVLATKDALDALNNIGCTLGDRYPIE